MSSRPAGSTHEKAMDRRPAVSPQITASICFSAGSFRYPQALCPYRTRNRSRLTCLSMLYLAKSEGQMRRGEER